MANYGGCKAPIGCIVALTALRSWSNCHFPDFFLITNIGVFQGKVNETICPAASCSCTRRWAAWNFSTHIGWLEHQVMGMGYSHSTMALIKSVQNLSDHWHTNYLVCNLEVLEVSLDDGGLIPGQESIPLMLPILLFWLLGWVVNTAPISCTHPSPID